jgi:hypothetical protein
MNISSHCLYRMFPAIAGLVMGMGLSSAQERGDWRLDCLREAKIATDTESLRKSHQLHHRSEKDLARMIEQLAADRQHKRREAHDEILRMDPELVLPYLQRLPASREPEVRLRLEMIRERIEWREPWDSEDLLRLAITGLLYERDHPGKIHPSRKMFVEFFRKPAASLKGGYGLMEFTYTEQLDGQVKEQLLHLSGKRPLGEGFQYLRLTAKAATGKPVFPDRFLIDVKIGGTAGGEGTYHVGISVGKIRALFHPGYDDGGFRFQRGENIGSVPNLEMGFTPATGGTCDMRIHVQRLDANRVQLRVEVRQEQNIFRTTQVFLEREIGPLDQISLDRSGREGGDAIFRDLIVQFAPP